MQGVSSAQRHMEPLTKTHSNNETRWAPIRLFMLPHYPCLSHGHGLKTVLHHCTANRTQSKAPQFPPQARETVSRDRLPLKLGLSPSHNSHQQISSLTRWTLMKAEVLLFTLRTGHCEAMTTPTALSPHPLCQGQPFQTARTTARFRTKSCRLPQGLAFVSWHSCWRFGVLLLGVVQRPVMRQAHPCATVCILQGLFQFQHFSSACQSLFCCCIWNLFSAQ